MATQTFTWVPLVEPTGTTKFLVRVAQFGDGYSQAVSDGINNKTDSWPLTFVGSGATISAIKAFLDSMKGATRFYWTPPLRTQALFRCTDYSVKASGGNVYTLSATFTEAF
jgi:phage-related protein